MIRLRKANELDIDQVFKWQCLPETRLYSRNTCIPKYEEHVCWMKQKLNDELCYFYIIVCEYEAVEVTDIGVVRLEPSRYSEQALEVSIYINPKFFGNGYASKALEELRNNHPKETLHAYVDSENFASHRLFVKCQYKYNGKIYISEGF